MKITKTIFTCCGCSETIETFDQKLPEDWTIYGVDHDRLEWPVCAKCKKKGLILKIMKSFPEGLRRKTIIVTTCDCPGCTKTWEHTLNNQEIGAGPNTPGWLHLTRTPTGVVDNTNITLKMGDGWDFCSPLCCQGILGKIVLEELPEP